MNVKGYGDQMSLKPRQNVPSKQSIPLIFCSIHKHMPMDGFNRKRRD